MKTSLALPSALALCVLLSNFAAADPAPTATVREIKIEHRWLNFRISSTAPLRHLQILADGKPVRVFVAQLSPDSSGWWSSLDVAAWEGSTVQVRISEPGADPKLLDTVDQTDEAREIGPDLYQESLRPRFHFSARRGWLNDPNGLVFCDGQYHLFFQHDPFTWTGITKHWGHAVSSDLVHWHEVDEALYPDVQGQMYSGSAVVDSSNSSGLVPGAKTPLVLVYTNAGHGSRQCLASTLDGIHFDKYRGNPVIADLPGPSRDPRAFWYAPAKEWVLALYVGTPDPLQPDKPGSFHDHHSVHLYVSDNLRDWRQTDVVEGGVGSKDKFLFECPDLFPLPAGGPSGPVKWILQGGNGEYEIGAFDGNKFTPESPRLIGRAGADFYAAQTFNNVPGGRIVQIGWMRAPSPGMPFNQCMSIPLDLSLRNTPEGLRLAYAPVEELKTLRETPIDLPAGALPEQKNGLAGVAGDSLDLEAELKPGTARSIVLAFQGAKITYDVAGETLQCSRFKVPLALDQGILRLRVLKDRTTLDIFAHDGLFYLPVAILPQAADSSAELKAVGGTAEIVSLKVYPLRSSWTP